METKSVEHNCSVPHWNVSNV